MSGPSDTVTKTVEKDEISPKMTAININIGVLGHVDSGKTSLVKALSSLISTAALDKNPQSRERGITLDLGFSAFTRPLTAKLREDAVAFGYSEESFLQVNTSDFLYGYAYSTTRHNNCKDNLSCYRLPHETFLSANRVRML